MHATLKTFTALALILVLTGEAPAGPANFSPTFTPNINPSKPVQPPPVQPKVVQPPPVQPKVVVPPPQPPRVVPKVVVKPIVPPRIVRPVITPRIDTRRLAKTPKDGQQTDNRQSRQQSPTKQQAKPANLGKSQPKAAPTATKLNSAALPPRKAAPIPERAPLPRAKPDGWALVPAQLPQPKPDRGVAAAAIDAAGNSGATEAGPQPEPPTLERNRPGARIDELLAMIGDLDNLRELERLRDLKEFMEGNRAIDDAGLGGGGDGQRNQFDWQGLTGHAEKGRPPGLLERLQGERNDPSSWVAAYDPRDPSSRPNRSQRGSASSRVFGPSARAGSDLPGQGGETSGDGLSSCGWNCLESTSADKKSGSISTHRFDFYPHPDNTVDDGDLSNGAEGAGILVTEYETVHGDGKRYVSRYTDAVDEDGNLTQLAHDTEESESLPPVIIEAGDGPDSQPADSMYGSGGDPFFECYVTFASCQVTEVDAKDLVSQPSRGGDDEAVVASQPSLAERKNVLTQPNPEGMEGTGGGGGGTNHHDPCIRAGTGCGPNPMPE